jgi:hypothetical protein
MWRYYNKLLNLENIKNFCMTLCKKFGLLWTNVFLHATTGMDAICAVSADCCMQHFDETCCGSESRICERENWS